MDGIHDMGGMHGFGPVVREENEPIFHHPWEGRVLAIVRATPIPIPGGMRNNIENMDPGHYLTSSYYEKWLHARIKGLVDAGAITAEELEERVEHFRKNPDAEVSRKVDATFAKNTQKELLSPLPIGKNAGIEPRFDIGSHIKAKKIHPAGHTRLPRYVRGKLGRVTRFYGIHGLQDTLPPGQPQPLEPLYLVEFSAEELWGESAEPNAVLALDMWETYLEPA